MSFGALRPVSPRLVVEVASVLFVAALPSRLEAQAAAGARVNLDAMPRPTATAVRTPTRLEIDGRLDEGAWSQAEVIDRFVQQKPNAGQLISESTEVRFLYDDDYLYAGAEMRDSDPSALITSSLVRDPNTRDGDTFGLCLNPFPGSRAASCFFVNPRGAVRDEQASDDGRVLNAAWDAAYSLKTRIHDRGWTVELAIPWSSLRFERGRDPQAWQINILRRVRRKNEDAVWAPMDRQMSLHAISRGGTLGGLSGIQPGRNLSVKPYVLTGERGAPGVDGDAEFDAGMDLKYGVTPGVTLDLTANTDFSQVEVDQQQVNLTRFSLFFPEKREFFLENAGVFQFGDQAPFMSRTGASNRDFTLFHSRRIGLTPTGSPLPILGGARLNGTVGPVSFGLLDMQTRRDSLFAPENFAVARVRTRPADGLTLGGIFVNRTTTSGGAAEGRSYGVDATYEAFHRYLLIQSYLAGTDGTKADGGPRGSGLAGRLSIAWRDPFWEVEALYRQFDDDFDPVVGFVSRQGIRHSYGTVGIHQRVSWGPVQELNPYVVTDYFHRISGALESREMTGGLDLEFRDGGIARASVSDRYEQVTSSFTVSGATVTPGAYDFVESSLAYESSRGRWLSGRASIGTGGYYGGHLTSVTGGTLARLGYRALVDLSAQHNRLSLPGRAAVSADVYSARLNGFFSTRLLSSAYVQYNRTTKEVVSNVRFNWIYGPLSDIYLVFIDRRHADDGGAIEHLVDLKVTRLVSF